VMQALLERVQRTGADVPEYHTQSHEGQGPTV
jgi:hypothetical protein